MPTNIATERLTDTEITAITEHAIKHAEPLPPGVLWSATADQLDTVAKMLDRGGFEVDAQELRRFVRVSNGARLDAWSTDVRRKSPASQG